MATVMNKDKPNANAMMASVMNKGKPNANDVMNTVKCIGTASLIVLCEASLE